MSPINFPDKVPVLVGDDVRLRELTEEDIPAWFERATDAESAALAGDPVPDSIEAGFQWLQLHRDRFRGRQGIRWAIVPAGLAGSVGTIGLNFTPGEDRVAELGAVIARAHWGKGIGTSAARTVVEYAFCTLGLAELRADLLETNVASKRVLEKLGFWFVRTLPNYDRSDTGVQEGCLYVLRGDGGRAHQRR